MNEKDETLPVDMTREEEAYGWVVRLDSDQRTRQDEARFDQWLEDDEQNAARFEEALEIWNNLGSLKTSAEAHEILGHLYDSDAKPAENGPRFGRRSIIAGGLTALAASLVGVIVVPDLLNSGTDIFETAKGEQRRIALADGSSVVLDTATRIRVALDDQQRLVTLERGQAFFDVAKDPTRPFRVFAGHDEIRAIGTAFEVRFEKGRARVILEEGKVAVFRGGAKKAYSAKTGGKTPAEKPDVILEPGQQLQMASATTTATLELARVAPVDLSKTNAWREGDLVFDDVPLHKAVAEVNRYGGRTIVLGDPALSDLRISGTFHTNRPEAFVEGVTGALPVRLQQSDASKLVLKSL